MTTNVTHPILTSTIRAATTTSDVQHNSGRRGVHLVINITSVPGTDTVTPKIVGTANGVDYDILVGRALDATGIVVLKVYPGLANIANGAANDILPEEWKVVMTHSASSNFIYAVSANLVK